MKAVIATGGKQYIVSEGEVLDVEALQADKGKVTFVPLMVIDGDAVTIGQPAVDKVTVTATVEDELVKADKVTAIRFKAKKRVKKVHGHRQVHSRITIASIK